MLKASHSNPGLHDAPPVRSSRSACQPRPPCQTAPAGVQEFPPYSFTDQSKHLVGAYVEMVDAVCHEWPDGCTITQLPNLRARKLLEVGELDGMFPLARSPEREQSLRFSHPLGAAS
ncbi:transporter substrate-binding domain-containing protein [Aeromonas jandaei]|uniref:transporter substrate-binding domain-containing protein n=1 Tax=Aeromonas jandaei TaxID=650 RepID=UPI003BA1D128